MAQRSGAWAPGEDPEIVSRTPWQLFWQRFREDRVALVALGFIGFEVAAAVAAPVIVHLVAHPPNAQFPSGNPRTCPADPTFEFRR